MAYNAAVGDTDVDGEPAAQRRNVDLTLVESLQVGPLEHASPTNDPLFKTIEPYSKINLK
jgi:hypothetical protein